MTGYLDKLEDIDPEEGNSDNDDSNKGDIAKEGTDE
jgi:hypothetical protein